MANNDPTSEGEYLVPETEITSSRCTMEIATATLDFEVIDDAQLQGMLVGESVTSRVFSVRGYKWVIMFHPNGFNNNCAGYASAFISHRSKPKPGVNAKYALSVLAGKESEAPPLASFPAKNYPWGGWSWGYHHFVHKSKLRSMSRLNDGRFTVRCVLALGTESPPLELPCDLERHLLGDAMGADVKLSVGGQEFRAHSSILAARSPEFRKQFFSEMMEKDMAHPEVVVDMEPTIFQMLLHFIYRESLPRCGDERGYGVAVMQHLLVSADRYGVDRLKLMCEEELCGKIDLDTVTIMLALANQHHCKQLKAACLEFMSSSPEVLGTIMETTEFKEHFMAACCRLLALDGGASPGTKGSN